MNAQKDSLSKMIADNTGEIESLKAGMEKAEKAIKDNAESVATLRSDLEKAKTDIKTAYEKAIEEAVGESEGTMSEKIAAEVKTINGRIDSVSKDINDKLAALGTRVSNLENDLKTLKNNYERRIQSLTHVPTYSDGVEKYEVTVIGGEFKRCRDLTLRFEVKPHSAAGSVTKEQVAVNAVHTITKAFAGDIRNLDIKDFSADAETGILTVAIDPTDLYKAKTENGLSSSVRIAVTDPSGLYDIASEYVKVDSIKDPGLFSYKTNNNQNLNFYVLKIYDQYNNEREIHREYDDGVRTIYSLTDDATLNLRITMGLTSEGSNWTLTEIHINKSVKLRTGERVFGACHNLTTITGLSHLDLRNVWTTERMFFCCNSLESLDLSGWDTRNLTDMGSMFENCESLKSLRMEHTERG